MVEQSPKKSVSLLSAREGKGPKILESRFAGVAEMSIDNLSMDISATPTMKDSCIRHQGKVYDLACVAGERSLGFCVTFEAFFTFWPRN